MKKIWIIFFVFLFLPGAVISADFSESSAVFDMDLAQYALQIAEMCYSPSMQEAVLAVGGYHRVGCYNMTRTEDDTRHVAAYSVYDRVNEDGRTEVIIAVRGTGKGEWVLNMDLMPSGDYDLSYAENFALAAEDILMTHADYLDSLNDPLFLVTGHSRGAAVSNVLGARLTDRFGSENVFAYTFATPGTVRGEYPEYDNIFNVINPADLVTYLPFPQWGFERYGIDLVLPVENGSLAEAAREAYALRADQTGAFGDVGSDTAAVQSLVQAMTALSPDVRSGYTIRHALSHPGEAADGEDSMTAGEVMLMIFDGRLMSRGSDPDLIRRLTASQNDFTPLLTALRSFGGSLITGMHMPAVYGAWLTAMAQNMP